jgi:hypothetical protein
MLFYAQKLPKKDLFAHASQYCTLYARTRGRPARRLGRPGGAAASSSCNGPNSRAECAGCRRPLLVGGAGLLRRAWADLSAGLHRTARHDGPVAGATGRCYAAGCPACHCLLRLRLPAARLGALLTPARRGAGASGHPAQPVHRVESGIAHHSWRHGDSAAEGEGRPLPYHPADAATIARCVRRGHPFVTSNNFLHSIRHPIPDPVRLTGLSLCARGVPWLAGACGNGSVPPLHSGDCARSWRMRPRRCWVCTKSCSAHSGAI